MNNLNLTKKSYDKFIDKNYVNEKKSPVLYILKNTSLKPKELLSKQNNIRELAEKSFLNKYPIELNLLLKLNRLEDDEDVIFVDKFYFSDDEWVLGEALTANKQILHGRVYYKYENGCVFIGYYNMGKANGDGKLIYTNGDYLEINYEEGERNGIGIHKSLKSQIKCEYEEGEFKAWL